MATRLSSKKIRIVLLISATLLQVFHLLVLTGILPYQIVGGGKLENLQQMYILEGVALAANTLFILLLLMKANYIRPLLSPRHANWLLSIFWGFFPA